MIYYKVLLNKPSASKILPVNPYYKISENTIVYHKTMSFWGGGGFNSDAKVTRSSLFKLLIEHIVIGKLPFG